jgi:hypothetical protein
MAVTLNSNLTKATDFPTELRNSAPNVQINLPSTVPSHSRSITEHTYTAPFAVVVQVSVIAISAFTVFHPWAVGKLGPPKTKFGFPLFISGTLCLNLAMMACTWVIERSTEEHVWRIATRQEEIPNGSRKRWFRRLTRSGRVRSSSGNPVPKSTRKGATTEIKSTQKEDSKRFQVFWLQQKHVVSDQDFDSYLLLGGSKEELLTSSRMEFQPRRNEAITVFAALLGISGFILQFEGLRSLPWPTAIAQLLAILIMALVRAFSRRHLGEKLAVEAAKRGFELDWLAVRLVYETTPPK